MDAAGRVDVAGVERVVLGTAAFTDDDAAKAAALWRFLPKAFKTYYNIPDPAAIEQRADAELPLDKVYADWPISTDPAVHVAALKKLFDSGVTIVNVHSGQPDQKKVIDFYGS